MELVVEDSVLSITLLALAVFIVVVFVVVVLVVASVDVDEDSGQFLWSLPRSLFERKEIAAKLEES